jgi:hypothetical protein
LYHEDSVNISAQLGIKAKDIYHLLEGSTSYELCQLCKVRKDIYDELSLKETKKIIGSLRIAWIIETLGPDIFKIINEGPGVILG